MMNYLWTLVRDSLAFQPDSGRVELTEMPLVSAVAYVGKRWCFPAVSGRYVARVTNLRLFMILFREMF